MRNREVWGIISERADVNIKTARRALWGVVEAVHEALRRREDITIYGLGTWRIVRRTPRVINFHGIQQVVGSRIVFFKASPKLRGLKN